MVLAAASDSARKRSKIASPRARGCKHKQTVAVCIVARVLRKKSVIRKAWHRAVVFWFMEEKGLSVQHWSNIFVQSRGSVQLLFISAVIFNIKFWDGGFHIEG